MDIAHIQILKFSQRIILLHCLPPHSSHLLQPLDVEFFRSLKSAWGKACNKYRAKAFGSYETKEVFLLESKLAASAPYTSLPVAIAPKPKLSSAAKKSDRV